MNLAGLHVKRGRYASAEDYYQRIITVDSNHITAYRALSDLAKRNGDLAVAFNYLLRANSLQPTNSDIAYDFAQLCMDLERYGRADTVLQLALAEDPQHGLLLLGKIKVAEKLKHYQEVVALGEQLRSEEHTSELQSLMRISYAVFCLKKKK